MPKNLYHCDNCEERFLAFHLMSENLEICEKCGSKSNLRRLPLFPVNINKNKNKEAKTGELVKDFIKDAKEDLKKEKKTLKEEEYKV